MLMGATAALVAGGGWYLAGRLITRSGSDAGGSGSGAGRGLVVVCQSKSGFYRADPLDADVEYDVDTPGTGSGRDARGGVNTVRIHGGTVDVVSANCENQLCVDHDPISSEGQQIVCLPHSVVVQIARSEDDVARLH